MDKKLLPPSHFLQNEDENMSEYSSDVELQTKLTALNVFSTDYLERNYPKQSTEIDEDQPEKEKPLHRIRNLRQENEMLHKLLEEKRELRTTKNTSFSHDMYMHHQNKENVSQFAVLQQNVTDLTTALIKKDKELSELNIQLQKQAHEKRALQSMCDSKALDFERLKQEIKEKNQMILESRAQHQKSVESLSQSYIQKEQALVMEWSKACEDLKHKISELENEISTKTYEFENTIKNTDYTHKSQIAELLATNKSELQLLCDRYKSEKEVLVNENNSLVANIEEIKKQIATLENESDEKNKSFQCIQNHNKDLQNEVDSLTGKLDKECKLLASLRSYVSDIQAEDLEREKWRTEKENLHNKLKTSEDQTTELNKSLELQIIRFNSMKKILETHEDTISAHCKAIPHGGISNPVRSVLTKWRGKVFELMVQAKSQEIVNREDRLKYTHKEMELHLKLQEAERNMTIASSQLSDAKAQYDLEKQSKKALLKENEKMKAAIELLEAKKSEYQSHFKSMVDIIEEKSNLLNSLMDEKFSDILTMNSRMEQRILFANNRLRTVKDLISRKQVVRHANRVKKYIHVGTSTQDLNTREDPQTLLREIETLVAERDLLSQKFKEDASVFENAVCEYKKQIESMEENINELQNQFDDRILVCNKLSSQIDEMSAEIENLKTNCSEAERKYTEIKNNFNSNLQSRINESEAIWHAEKLELETKYNDAKTQVAKGLISARQAQRSFARELKSSTEDLQTSLFTTQEQMKMLRRKYRQMEQDNNLLMTTLRQEGLISAYRANRAEFKKSMVQCKNDSSSTKQSGDSTEMTNERNDIKSNVEQENNRVDEEDVDKCATSITENSKESENDFERMCNEPTHSTEAATIIDSPNKEHHVKTMLQELVAMTEDVLHENE